MYNYYTEQRYPSVQSLQGTIAQEMEAFIERNLQQILTNRTVEATDMLSSEKQNLPESSKQTESDTVSKVCNQDNSKESANAVIQDECATSSSRIISETLPCEIPSEKPPVNGGVSMKFSAETTSDHPSCCATVSNVTSTQPASIQAFLLAEPPHISQNTESNSPPFTSLIPAKGATYQDEVVDASLSRAEYTDGLVSENNTQNFAAETNASPVNAHEAQLLQQIQTEMPPTISTSESSEAQTLPAILTQTSSEEALERQVEQICATVLESLGNRSSISDKNSAIPTTFEVSCTNEIWKLF